MKVEAVCEGLTKQVDDAFIISSEEPNGVFEEEHEGCIDDSISQLIGIDLRESSQPTHLYPSLVTAVFIDTEKQWL